MRLIDADKLADEIAVFFERNEKFIDEWLMSTIEDEIENAPTVDAVQGEKMSNQRVIEWVPIRERKPHLPGIYLVTAKTYDGIKEDGRTISTAAHFTPNGFLLEGVIAWAEMPAVWTDEQEQLTLF